MIRVSGLKDKQKALQILTNPNAGWVAQVKKIMGIYGEKMALMAKKDHEYTSQSGNLERSTDFDLKDMKLTLGLDDGLTITKGGKSYGTFLHEGTYKGYRRSKAANAYTPTQPKKGYGILADHFIVRAWDKYIGVMKNRIQVVIKKELQDAL